MRPVRIYALPRSTDADGIAASQSLGGAGALTLDGVLVVNGVAVITRTDTDSSGRKYSKIGQTVTITSSGNESAKTFTVVGKDQDGQDRTVSLSGPNATVTSVSGYWSSVSSVSIDAASAGNVTVGILPTFSTPTIPLDHYVNFGIALSVVLGGTATYTVQHTMDEIGAQTFKDGWQWVASTANWFNNDGSDLVSATASADGNYTLNPAATRLICSSWTSGTVEYQVISARVYA